MIGTLRLPPAAALAMLLPWLTAPAAHAEDGAATLCRSNPAFAMSVIQGVLAAQLERDHDPALDTEPPSQMAAEAVEQGVKDCAETLRHDPATDQVLQTFTGADREIAWDAYNTSCADHVASRADCIRAEVGSVRALKHMVAHDDPPGAKSLVETCQLVLKPEPPMADWRECVDLALATHPDRSAADRCKTSVAWHTTTSGANAGHMLAACLGAGK